MSLNANDLQLGKEFQVLNVLEEQRVFYICGKYSISEVPNWEAVLSWEKRTANFLFLPA